MNNLKVGDIWFDWKNWYVWTENNKWVNIDPSEKTKLEYLKNEFVAIETIIDSYIELEELVRDFVRERPTDKWVLKFKPALEHLYDF